MSFSEPQDINAATVTNHRPDNKTRRYDRQLRLWAASGQEALESSKVLVISASATSTSILKNLVLPGIGQFTIIDDKTVTPEDAGNNFFLNGNRSIGRLRAEEAVACLCELNDGVEGISDTSNFERRFNSDPSFLAAYTMVIAHNLHPTLLDKVAEFLWADLSLPALIVIRSAGFLAEFFIQFHEHHVIESHSENLPSLRIDKPFSSLLEHAMSLDFANMDPTDHGHIPYIIILVRAMEEWRSSHDGKIPKTYQEKKAFRRAILDMRVKVDEENFEEAESQAYRCWTETTVPPDIADLLSDPVLSQLSLDSPQFYHLLEALRQFTLQPPYTLPLTSTLPDMKADTANYIRLQRLYKEKAEEDKKIFRGLVRVPVDEAVVDLFVRNAHHLKLMWGTKWGQLDKDPAALVSALSEDPEFASIHLAFSALSSYIVKNGQNSGPLAPTEEELLAEVKTLLGGVQISGVAETLKNAVGELARTPTADVPNTAAFMGGVIAQETIKIITKQYVPQRGYCVIDLVDSKTGVVQG
ncbi:hypothetical protein BDM02DRAFT_3190778 [Thelephora ganbajun]|uniref:Uncharacterized protein n=1 Tax=Thelephora ganbajun TaxID=370292 RepID=A0ACB6Z4P8_THEGA|nr:hypothetical protein BDM02DRAFT_3190778 [Thelephora ganbajun]